MSKQRPIRLDDDFVDAGVPLRERYERFVGHFLESNNRMQAYRLSFVVDPHMANQWVHEQSSRLLKDPAVMARVQELRDAAAAQTIVTVRDIIQDLHDIATADPNELIAAMNDACRFCHGLDHRYQWVNEPEWALACDAVLATPAKEGQGPPPLPDMAGGFGYSPNAEPNPTCPACFGRGHLHVQVYDTRKVSPAARKLYAGVKQTKEGVQVLMHDQMKAREMLGRVLGAFKDGIPVTPTAPAPISKDAKEADAGRSYLRLVSGQG